MTARDPHVEALIEALVTSVDADRLKRMLRERFAPPSQPQPKAERPLPAAGAGLSKGVADKLLERFAMADLLDDSILGARPGQTTFPLRLFFGALSERATEETTFALGSGINFFFRASMEEETKTRLGLEVSRLYYQFVAAAQMETKERKELSPLLAKLLSTQLDRVRLEAVDHAAVYDSSVHERSADSNATSSAIVTPMTFVCRVSGNDRVRFKALVRT